ncbi:T6SS immunity protein Tli4 family protein [Collimonas sp.]|uniref:T6SS immunity protein Tli4 family protein n=1 Tax=Collimonas sp. TaxID=1963772 RepID=UPI002C687A20|nr:T6SS immunity protein Tli4 family protein [Collimonas sp.]HWW05254.1 T6SS immunity protein Tli4 family protein [Collimonas sp.]
MNKVSSICFGRFLIDLPEGSQVKEIGQQSEFMFGPVVSEGPEVDEKKFAARMDKREAELKAVTETGEYKFSKSLSPLPNTKILVSSRTLFGSTAYAFDAGRVVNGELFSIKQESFSATKIDSILDGLQNKLLPQLRIRQPDEIPAEPGFCIKSGFIASDGSGRALEEARIQINFKDQPDLWVSVYSRTVNNAGQKTLLQRIASNPLPAELASVAGQVRNLREGAHSVGNYAGEETLDVIPTEEGVKVHHFVWEIQGAMNDPFKPTLHLEFSTGNGQGKEKGQNVRPKLSDDQAIKLFDSIVNSIRLRPTGPAKVSSAEPTLSSPQAPLGEIVASGSVCPQTGWWQCVETGNVDGDRRRFFKAGEAMPAVVLLGDVNIWQSLRGQRPTHSLNTVWSLVAYEEVPAVPSATITKTDADDTPGTTLPDKSTPG